MEASFCAATYSLICRLLSGMYEVLSKEALSLVVVGKNVALIRMAANAARDLTSINPELQVSNSGFCLIAPARECTKFICKGTNFNFVILQTPS